MAIRAHVATAWNASGVAVSILIHDGEAEAGPPRSILRFSETGHAHWQPWDEETFSTAPTMTLPHEVAPALLAGLRSHFEGFDDQRALRKDYTDERRRVDKLTDALVDLAKANAHV